MTLSVASSAPAPAAFAEQGVCGEALKVNGPAAQVIVTVDGAFAIAKELETVTAESNPPAPVARALQGSIGLPVKVRESGHATATWDGALSIVNVFEEL